MSQTRYDLFTHCHIRVSNLLPPESIMYIEDNNGLHLFKDMQLKEDDNPVVFMHELR